MDPPFGRWFPGGMRSTLFRKVHTSIRYRDLEALFLGKLEQTIAVLVLASNLSKHVKHALSPLTVVEVYIRVEEALEVAGILWVDMVTDSVEGPRGAVRPVVFGLVAEFVKS